MASPRLQRRIERQRQRVLSHVVDATPKADTRYYVTVRAITREELRAREGLSERPGGNETTRSGAFRRFTAQLERIRHG